MPLAQAFQFLDMDEISRERFSSAAEQMQQAGFSDVEQKGKTLDLAYQSLSKLRESIRLLSLAITPVGRTKAKK